MSEKLIIIDGNALIHRSFHALPSTLQTKNGLSTNAVYGFTSFLIKALNELKPHYAILTLDKKGPTFRHEKYEEYKATRVKAPQELYDQIPLSKKIAEAFNIPVFELEGYEADDLIGTISQKISKEENKIETIIITGDLDTLQLVNKKTKVYTMSRGLSDSVLYNEDKILEKYQLKPEQIIDLKAIKGDASDNIPGVPGIGEKGASDLLLNFGSLDNIYKNINSPKIKERTRKLLLDNKELAYLSQDLATINKEAPIKINLEDSRLKNLDKSKINKIFSELEFKSLLNRVLKLDFIKSDPEEVEDKFIRNQEKFNYKLVKDEKSFTDFIKKLEQAKSFSLDTETNALNPLEADLLGISFSWKENEAYFVELKLKNKNKQGEEKNKTLSLFESNKEEEKNNKHPWLEKLKTIIENEKTEKIAHNLKYDLQVLLNYDVKIKGKIFDTMLASYVLNPENRQHNLDTLSFVELNWEKISPKDLLEKSNTFQEVDLEKLALYSCEDADCTFKLKNIFEKRLKESKLEKVFRDIEMPLIEVLADMEKEGIELDEAFLKNLGKEINKEIEEIRAGIFKEAQAEFNVNSTKQLKEILFEKLKIATKGIKKTKTGFSTSSDELEKLKDLHPIISLIQRYRELSKLKSTYIDALPKLINQKTKRIHTSFNQTITATGRLSSSDPNLQNIPTRTDLGQKIRQAFVVPDKWTLLSIDYSQIELRVMAHLSADKKLIEAFKNKQDIHRFTAASINNISLEEVSDKLRYQAKAINFGILYGQGPHGLSQAAGIQYWEAKDFIKKYFQVYSGVQKYSQNLIKNAEKNGYVETLFGRKRSLPEINSKEVLKKKAAERMAINTPVQGTAADILKLAMIKIYQEIKDKNDIKMLLQVHDELIFEIAQEKVEFYYQIIKDIMENIVKLKVPLVTEAVIGKNWGQMTSL